MEMSKEVESASVQQDEGINQVNKAIVQFDTVVQNNASSAEETASSAEEMQGQVESLNGVVTGLQFIVSGKASGEIKSLNKHASAPRPTKAEGKALMLPQAGQVRKEAKGGSGHVSFEDADDEAELMDEE
jgi:methyl-accepting chemotaxis protein